MSDSLQPHGLQQARIPCPSPTPRACSNSVHQVGDAIQPSGKEQILLSHNGSLSQPLLSVQPEIRIAEGTSPLGNPPEN